MRTWARLTNGTRSIGELHRRLIGRTRTRPNSTASGARQSPRNSSNFDGLPPMHPTVEHVLSTYNTVDMIRLPYGSRERAYAMYLGLSRNPYSATAESEARYIALAIAAR